MLFYNRIQTPELDPSVGGGDVPHHLPARFVAALLPGGDLTAERGHIWNPVRACETVIMRPIVQSTFAALWSAVLVVWEAASVEAAHEREAIPQPSRRGG